MYYRLSNTAGMKEIERNFDSTFDFPKLYETQHVINGLKESSIPVITMQKPSSIQFAIWGVLPEGYTGEWQIFQDNFNTLNINYNQLKKTVWCCNMLETRRCIIIANGIFCSRLFDGELYPYYVTAKNQEAFGMAGVYNVLEDGFITASFLTSPLTPEMKRIQHIGDHMPHIMSAEDAKNWIDPSNSETDVEILAHLPVSLALNYHPIAKEFFDQNITYKSGLEPVIYRSIPKA
ncbi:hypothetical protein GCM10009117_12870 [Gangjinia marincola]|uniref:Abasic site processing protein n=1 Tax=Gangjinia marincola TaxID=578463 RepID=A0ABN1MH11_9FLAO